MQKPLEVNMCECPLLPTSYVDCHRLLKHVKGGWEAADGSGASTSSGLNVRIASGTSSGNETSCDGGWPLPSKMHGAARLLGLLGSGLVCVVRDPRKRGETLHFLLGHEEAQSLHLVEGEGHLLGSLLHLSSYKGGGS